MAERGRRYRAERPTTRYGRDVRAYMEKHPEVSGKEARRIGGPVWQARDTLRSIAQREKQGIDVDRSPRGEYARALEDLGYRDDDSPYDVGSTPKRGKK